MLFTADFETTTYIEENKPVRIWAFGVCEIGNTENFIHGTNMYDFMKFCSTSENHTLYFHNLKFDGDFIIYHLLSEGYTWVKDRKEMTNKTFTTLISDMNQFYSIEICFKKQGKHTNKVTIYDSLKIIPFGVEQVGKSFKLPVLKIHKESEFYNKRRDEFHKLTEEEIAYLKNDVTVMAMALKIMFDENLKQMTQGSNALHDFKNIIGKEKFEKYFPIPDYDGDIRQSYKGGFTYADPRTQGQTVGGGIVLDVNSLYPSVMYYKPLPYGEGKYFNGKYKSDKIYNLYVQMFTCQFELKKDKIPTLQIKGNLSSFIPTEYVRNSGDEEVTLCLTSVDLELFFEHYEVYNIDYISGWKFKSTTKLFKEYIDKWTEKKIQATIEKNEGQRTLAKLMLNSLYGKFALNPEVESKYPKLDENGVVKYISCGKERRNPIYIPVGTFITAWARNITITSAQKVYPYFMYADTDSLHLSCTLEEVKDILEIDKTKLGAWKHELTFVRAKYLRAKSYIEDTLKECKLLKGSTKLYKRTSHITCAGMSSRCYQYVNFENFHIGTEYNGKLTQKHVKGGIILKETTFKIKG